VADMTTWIGLQVVNRHSAVRIKNLGTNVGKGMTDDLAFEALATARRGSNNPTRRKTLLQSLGRQLSGRSRSRLLQQNQTRPVNRRALEQLRRRRTKVTSATGVPTLPDNVAGIPIVFTDSLSNAKA